MSTSTWEERAIAAERTVVVLKRKVKELYNGDATPAFKRQLDRAQARQLAAQRKRELLEARANELTARSESLASEVLERTADLRTVLDNVSNGFLVTDRSLVVAPGASRSCERLLATDVVSGKSVAELLSRGDRRSFEAIACSLQQVFDELLPEVVTLDAVPRRFVVAGRILHADVRTIRAGGPASAIEKVLFTLTDATQLEAAEQRAWENALLVAILRQREMFVAFVNEAREGFSSVLEALTTGNHTYARRALHTIKGNAAAFDLTMIVEKIHEAEAEEEIAPSAVRDMAATLSAFLARHADVIGVDYDQRALETFAVSAENVDELRAIVRREGADLVHVERWTAQVVLKPAHCLLGPLSNYVTKLAERLGKQVQFRVRGAEVLVDARTTRAVLQNMTHLVRNAVDHGLEESDVRLGCGKSGAGRLEVDISEDELAWMIAVRDDGRGIDASAVARAAVTKGFATAGEVAGMSPDEQIRIIFADGFSTSEVASDVSGRGIGMSAIKAAVEAQHGTISIATKLGQGTAVLVRIPKPRLLLAPRVSRGGPETMRQTA